MRPWSLVTPAQIFKDKLEAKLLTERLRWKDESKVYSAKVYAVKQAKMLLECIHMVSAFFGPIERVDDRHRRPAGPALAGVEGRRALNLEPPSPASQWPSW